MKYAALLVALAACASTRGTTAAPTAKADQVDPYLWLEEVTSEKALAWAKDQNKVSTAELTGDPRFEPLRKRLLSILDAHDKIPFVNKQAEGYYNFWRDDQHPRGLWRRVRTLAEYRKADPPWETVLDLDALAAQEKENWVWKGAT